MVRRFGLLLAMAATMLFACAAVVLAQSTRPEFTDLDSQRAAEEDSESTSAALSSLSAGDPVPDRYIVVLKDDARGEGRASSAREESAQVASEMAQEHSLEVKKTYRNALKGFAARIPEEQVNEVRSDERVEFVAEDTVVKAFTQTTTPPSIILRPSMR